MTTKTCVTCIFKEGSKCTKQWRVAPRINPVSGKKEAGTHFMCETQRSFESDSCGDSGRWWTPITPKSIQRYRSDVDNEPKPNIFSRAIRRLLSVLN